MIFRRSCGKMSHKLARNILSHSHAFLGAADESSICEECMCHEMASSHSKVVPLSPAQIDELMRESGVIKPPSQRTLKDYTHYIQATPGFSPKVDQQLMEAAEIATCPEFKKYVFLLLDEMHVKEDLVYDKHTGSFVGEKRNCMWL